MATRYSTCKACDIWIATQFIALHNKSQAHINKCERKDIYCHLCNRAFSNNAGLRSHNKSCHNVEPRRVSLLHRIPLRRRETATIAQILHLNPVLLVQVHQRWNQTLQPCSICELILPPSERCESFRRLCPSGRFALPAIHEFKFHPLENT